MMMLTNWSCLTRNLPYFFRANKDGHLFFMTGGHLVFFLVFTAAFIFLLCYMRSRKTLTAFDRKVEAGLHLAILSVIVLLYSWYFAAGYTKDHLPLYHCRLIMIIIVILGVLRLLGVQKTQSVIEQLTLSLSTMGAWMAALVAMPDEFFFPHVTNYTYAVGHFALLGIVFYYVKRWQREPNWSDLGKQQIILLIYNILLAVYDFNRQENYGYLYEAPIATEFFRQLPQVVYSAAVIGGYAVLLLLCWQINRLIYRYIHCEQSAGHA